MAEEEEAAEPGVGAALRDALPVDACTREPTLFEPGTGGGATVGKLGTPKMELVKGAPPPGVVGC